MIAYVDQTLSAFVAERLCTDIREPLRIQVRNLEYLSQTTLFITKPSFTLSSVSRQGLALPLVHREGNPDDSDLPDVTPSNDFFFFKVTTR